MTRALTHPLIRLLAAVILSFAVGSAAGAQSLPWSPTSVSHAWAKFGPRTWKTVRVVTQAYDTTGKLEQVSTSIIRTRVTRVTRRGVGLCISTRVQIAGDELPAAPKLITSPFSKDSPGFRRVGKKLITIGMCDYETLVYQSIVEEEGTRRTDTVYYSDKTTPGVLKREMISREVATNETISTTAITVTELAKTRSILGASKKTWTVATVMKRGGRTTISTEINCGDVPGALVSRTTEERDSDGRILRRTKLDLTGFGVGRVWGRFGQYRAGR